MASPALTAPSTPIVEQPARQVSPTLESLFERLAEIASLPTIAREIITVTEDDDAGIADLLPVVEQDPALATNIVRCANSSYYAPREPIGDLKTALAMMGMDQARNQALTVVIGERFTAPTLVGELDRQRLWDHSVCTAAAARALSAQTRIANPEQAYLAGLIHDFGLLVIDQHLEGQTPRVMVRFRTGQEWTAAEQEVMGFDHAQLGGYIAWRSGMPADIVEAIEFHHQANRSLGETGLLTCIVSVANYLVTRMSRGSIHERRLEPPSQTVFDRLDLNQTGLRTAWQAIEEQLAHVGGIV